MNIIYEQILVVVAIRYMRFILAVVKKGYIRKLFCYM